MNYISVRIGINPFSEDIAEQLIALIEDLGYESFEISDNSLKAYITEDKYSSGNLKVALSFFDNRGDVTLNTETEHIREENWNLIWESNFSPITIGKLCTVKASFHKNLPKTKYTIKIDPKMAFGTGHHQTTRLMMESMLNEDFNGKQVLDMGCGTGILSILAAKLGADSPVHSIDIDYIATESAIENCRKNRVSKRVSVLTGDASLIQRGRYDIILANINRNIILSDISTYAGALRRDGFLLLSGFYVNDIEMIVSQAKLNALEYVCERSLDNWVSLKLKKVVTALGD